MPIEFVIAKYKEDMSWTKDLAPHIVTIYDKSTGELPNVGREAHTYLYHIVKNYDKLNDVTVFLQGNPFDHVTLEGDLNTNVQSYSFDKTEPFFNTRRFFERTRLCNRTYRIMFGYDPGDLYFSNGAMWIVQKQDILARPLEFYQRLFEHLCIPRSYNEDGVFNAWTMECMWQFIFCPTIPVAPSFYSVVPGTI